MRLSGADAALAPSSRPVDGVYAVAGCHAGRPLYVRQAAPGDVGGAAAPRVLWYSATFHDWDVTIGAEPNPVSGRRRGGREKKCVCFLTRPNPHTHHARPPRHPHLTQDDIAIYGGRGGREAHPQDVPAGTWRVAADLQSSPADASTPSADGYTPSGVTIACADGRTPPSPKAGGKPSPLLTDSEMASQYASIYARARRVRATSRGPGAAAVPVFVVAAVAAAIGVPLAASRAVRRRRRARGRPAANPAAGVAPGVAGLFGVKRDHAH